MEAERKQLDGKEKIPQKRSRHGCFFVKILCFAAAAAIMVQTVNQILMPKYLYDNDWPTTQTVSDFYQLDKDSIDVLFLGSSHCMSAFSPLELYEAYEISSYNLGTEQQSILMSYFWLKEALRYQSPQVVVLDTFFLFPYEDGIYGELNSDEPTQRKSIDFMKWSSVKMEAISAICENDDTQSEKSYYFPNIRFHARWTELNEDDFSYGFTTAHAALMGYSALNDYSLNTEDGPFSLSDSDETAQPVALMEEYLEKIVQLCEEEGIELILVKTPNKLQTVQRHNYVQKFAIEHDVQFIDFNEENLYKEIEYDYPYDNKDNGHLTVWGATKVTNYIGQVLQQQYGVKSRKSEQHESLIDYYESVKKDCKLKAVTDFAEYLDELKDDRYAVILSVKDEGFAALTEELKEELVALGVSADLNDMYRKSYYLVICDGKVEEGTGNEALTTEGTVLDGTVQYSITSAGYESGNKSSIKINGKEYSVNGRGMNIVVYNLETEEVIDSVCFDTHSDLQATRKD